jgi:peroxiredoxin Q/BCP
MTLKVGDTAPDFAISDDGAASSLYALLEQGPVIIYFYPRDFTPGCTIQAKGFRDEYADFQAADAQIVGISCDGERSHADFRETHSLPFPLVSDCDSTLANSFGVKPILGLIPDRVSFVIGRDRRILDVYRANIRCSSHVEHTLDFVRGLGPGSAQT